MLTRRTALSLTAAPLLANATQGPAANTGRSFPIRPDYLKEAASIPEFWLSTVDDVSGFLQGRVSKGKVETIGKSAGGRNLYAVSYGTPRQGRGSSTFSGSLGYGDVRAYLGPDWRRTVYFVMSGVHGGEFEGIVGSVNLLSVLETGKDLRGKEWPRLSEAASKLGRIVVLPLMNPDGRARIPLRMLADYGPDFTVAEYMNTGGKLDGTLIGWPRCKQNIPLDFSTVQFPGGYPNDAGVNLAHDDFIGHPQPETRAIFEITARERPDFMLNMHTGARFFKLLRPHSEPVLSAPFDAYYRRLLTRLTNEGLQASRDVAKEANPSKLGAFAANLNTVLNMHCGVLILTTESPSHSSPIAKSVTGEFRHTPDILLDEQLTAHEEAMWFLLETGGRIAWTTRGGE